MEKFTGFYKKESITISQPKLINQLFCTPFVDEGRLHQEVPTARCSRRTHTRILQGKYLEILTSS